MQANLASQEQELSALEKRAADSCKQQLAECVAIGLKRTAEGSPLLPNTSKHPVGTELWRLIICRVFS